MNGKPWSAVDHAQLRELYPHIRTDALARILGRSVCSINGQVSKLGLRKSAEYLASPDACRLRRDGGAGVAYRFPKGHVPANKGLRRPGWAVGRMRETQFKKGESLNKMPLLSTRPIKGGYLLLKVAEAPNVPYTVNWIEAPAETPGVRVHRIK